MKKRWAIAGVVAALLWVFVVVAFYYIRHKPFEAASFSASGASQPGSALGAVAGLAGAALVVATGTGVGLQLVRRLELTAIERLVWASAAGLGVLSLVGLGLGTVGLLLPAVLWPLTILVLAATGRSLCRAIVSAWRDTSWRPRGSLEVWLAVFCMLMLGVALILALLPPTAWDSLAYHITGPKLYLESGVVSHPLDIPYLGFPQLMEMLFTWGMGLAGDQAAAPIHAFYGLLAVGVLVTAGRRWLGGAAGWIAAAVLLSTDTVVIVAGWPYVDIAILVYSTLAFLALMRAKTEGAHDRRWLVTCGAMAGLALSTKYTGLTTVVGLGITLLGSELLERKGPRDWRAAIRAVLIVCGVALLVWSPWLVKNLLLTDNPVYPFFFNGLHWDDWRGWWYDRPGTGFAETPWKLITAPWDATIWGIEGGAGYSATIGPLFLALLPLLLLSWRHLTADRRSWLRPALLFVGELYGFWLWGVARSALTLQTRLLMPAFGMIALVCAAAVTGLRSLPRRPVDLSWMVRAVVVGVLGLTLASTLYCAALGRPLSVLAGSVSEENYLTWRLGWHHIAIDTVNRVVEPEGIVLFLWEPRSYYCERTCWPDALLDRWLHTTHVNGHDARAIADTWRATGVTHVLFHKLGYEIVTEAGFDPITDADHETLQLLIDAELELIVDLGGEYRLYVLRGW
ncbi:MAG: phospholipid carrier-dependent glycosyltransferase [Anaerolineales bacterium]|nr:MAG: phospholipid carrier-dependent glycosyltransferase [Anaerolineales bacterium]